MDLDTARKVNLLEFLAEEQPEVAPPPDDAAEIWSEAQIRQYYATPDASLASLRLAESAVPHVDTMVPVSAVGPTASSPASAESPSTPHPAGGSPAEEAPLSNEAQGQAPTSYHIAATAAQYSSGSGGLTTAAGSSVAVSAEPPAPAMSQPGGGVVQTEHPDQEPINAPVALRRHQIAATVAGYRAAVIADGIPFRAHGLFPPYDPLLLELGRKPGCHAFEKHMAGSSGCYELQPRGGWTTGDAAAHNGLDLRLFWQEATKGETWGTLVGAARLGEKASIGHGSWSTAHGGAIESLLDEATAELSKMEWSPMVSTIEIAFKIKKPVPLNTSLRIECTITNVRGIRCWVDGAIKDESGVTLATCEAQLVDMSQLWK